MNKLGEYPARKVCQILQIPRSSYYDVRRNGVRRHVYKEAEQAAVYDKFLLHNGSFGRRTIQKLLQQEGVHISEHKVSKIMKELGLRAKYGRRKGKNVNTSKNTEHYVHENLFAQLTDAQRDVLTIWSMDFTEQKIDGKTIYTCGVIDVRRKILVGYAQSGKCTATLAVQTVEKAIVQYGVPDMIMTDRGSQFTSKLFFDTMMRLGITHSMSRPRKPVDNRFIETFWKSMKVEIGKTNLLTQQTYRLVVEYYIYYYNHLRPHSTLGYKPPLAA